MTSPAPRTVPVGAGTALRSGVSADNPQDNTLVILPEGQYPAEAQCTGGRVTFTTATNIWWVKITANGQTGWVTAVAVLEGTNDQPITGVTVVPTVNP